uniref:Antifreeze protein n=1 Tax=Romanomermis culicivorax TaxID=13658 RepID=A0A915KFZ0_ROMCU
MPLTTATHHVKQDLSALTIMMIHETGTDTTRIDTTMPIGIAARTTLIPALPRTVAITAAIDTAALY